MLEEPDLKLLLQESSYKIVIAVLSSLLWRTSSTQIGKTYIVVAVNPRMSQLWQQLSSFAAAVTEDDSESEWDTSFEHDSSSAVLDGGSALHQYVYRV